MQVMWLAIAIVATVGYHLVLKVTPAPVNPFLSLAVSYLIGATVFIAIYATMPGSTPLRESLQVLNWTAIALAVTVVGLDVGFLLLYRSGFNVSFGQLVTQSAAALLLLLLGVAFFREKLSLANIGGILLCVVGLWLINRR
ncbi:MAG TPA: EamA family transporter [Steroidobacteraceae bacterium]|nr:EamA family transporter [Steroidobacteraceae bacterium]